MASIQDLPDCKRVPLLTILTHSDFADCRDFRSQIAYIKECLEQYPEAGITQRDLAGALSACRGSISWQIQRLKDHPKPNGRPRLLTAEAYGMTRNLIQLYFERKEPVSIRFLLEQIEMNFNISLSADTMLHIVNRMAECKIVDGIPMERARVMADPTVIDIFCAELATIIEGVPADFIINVDETGCDDFADARPEKVIVPATYADDTIPIPADRAMKRATLVGAIVAIGTVLKPMIIVQRKTIALEVQKWGYRDDRVMFVHQENGYITTTRFGQWIQEILIPYVRQQRDRIGYAGRAVLLLDGCSCHHPAQLDQELEANQILLRVFPPHTSDQLQPLDLGIFGVFKRHFMNRIPVVTRERQSSDVIRMCDAWQQATLPRNIVSAFQSAGLDSYKGVDGKWYMTFQREFASRVRHWRTAPAQQELRGDEGRKRLRLS
jgi:hypothetical protein